MWASDECKEAREAFGEEYSDEAFAKASEAQLEGLVCAKYEPGATWLKVFKNNDLKNFEAIKGLNQWLGIEWKEVDPVAIEAVNMERMKNLQKDMIW